MSKGIKLEPELTLAERAAVIETRLCAEDVWKVAVLMADEVKPHLRGRYFEELLRLAQGSVPSVETKHIVPDIMCDERARKFEHEKVPNGTFKGLEVIELPIWYIDGVYASDFGRDMQRYLKSDRYRRRLNGEL